MPSKQLIQVALVDDHALFREGLISLLEMVCKNCVVLFEADNGIDLKNKIQKDQQPDLILMDISMSDMDGYAAVEWIKNNFPLIKILVVTMIGHRESIIRMLKLGVNGYVTKDVEPGELKAALKAVMNGEDYFPNKIADL